jgi:antitoxin (DNA-binding transcriptional repressor) of toxin-antitoxin stability system
MKSNEVRVEWADVLQYVRQGGTVIVEHYNKPIATIAPYEETPVQNTQRLAEQITPTLGDRADDFDIAGIAELIGELFGFDVNIDDIPGEKYWEIVQKYDITDHDAV